MSKQFVGIDPEGCGCVDCIMGWSRPASTDLERKLCAENYPGRVYLEVDTYTRYTRAADHTVVWGDTAHWDPKNVGERNCELKSP